MMSKRAGLKQSARRLEVCVAFGAHTNGMQDKGKVALGAYCTSMVLHTPHVVTHSMSVPKGRCHSHFTGEEMEAWRDKCLSQATEPVTARVEPILSCSRAPGLTTTPRHPAIHALDTDEHGRESTGCFPAVCPRAVQSVNGTFRVC